MFTCVIDFVVFPIEPYMHLGTVRKKKQNNSSNVLLSTFLGPTMPSYPQTGALQEYQIFTVVKARKAVCQVDSCTAAAGLVIPKIPINQSEKPTCTVACM